LGPGPSSASRDNPEHSAFGITLHRDARRWHALHLGLFTAGLLVPRPAVVAQSPPAPYFPPPGLWERRAPAALGMDEAKLSDALRFAASRGATSGVLRLDDPVGRTIGDGGDDSPRNALVTWKMHLQQESEWEGALWGKAHDFVGRQAFGEGGTTC
jgi:hypothetical protein